MNLNDKNSVMQVIGCLMKDPSKLAEIDKYRIEVKDFEDKFHKIIFAAIYNLFNSGAYSISEIDVDNYLTNHGDFKALFDKNNGITYLQDCLEFSDTQNFNYYYQRLKKFSALRQLQKNGYDVSPFYCEDPLNKNYQKIQNKFDEVDVNYFFDEIKKNLASLEDVYISGKQNTSILAAENIKMVKEKFKVAPEIGMPVQGDIFNTVIKGARLGTYVLRSAGTNTGKTRCAVGDACALAYPLHFDWSIRKWINTSISEKVLFITTEMDAEEIQTIILAWISGLNEEVILNGRYSPEQEKIVDFAIQIMDNFKENFVISHIADPSIDQIEACVRKNVLINGCKYIFYDYIFSSPSLLNQFRDLKIREDVALAMFSTALKDLAVELNVYVQSATQLSGDYENKRGIRNQSFLRGSKAVADKVDCGTIMMEIGQEEKDIITPVVQRLGKKIPNIVTDVYKVRRGRYKNVKIWSYIDLGTARREDVLITDGNYNPIEGFEVYKVEHLVQDTISFNQEEKRGLRDLF